MVTAVPSRRHLDLCGNPAVGFVLRLGRHGPSLGFTSDVPAPDGTDWSNAHPLLASDVLVAHVSSLPLSELRLASGLARQTDPTTVHDREDLLELFDWVDGDDAGAGPVAARLRYAYWLGKKRDGVDLVGSGGLTGWRPPSDHLYLGGLAAYAAAHRARRPDALLVVSELGEELGSLRGKIAAALNDELSAAGSDWKAVTADIGLAISIGRSERRLDTRLRCTTCDSTTTASPSSATTARRTSSRSVSRARTRAPSTTAAGTIRSP